MAVKRFKHIQSPLTPLPDDLLFIPFGIIIIVAMLKVDWEKFFPRVEKEKKKKQEKP